MTTRLSRLFSYFISILLLTSCIQPFQGQTNQAAQTDGIFASSGKVTERQLQAEVMAFSDQYSMVIWQAMDELHRSDLPPDKKLAVEYNKLLYTSSAISIAAQPSPVASLLDMITFVRLGHKAAENYWVPEVYGPAGKPLLAAYQRLEEEVWQLAALVLSEQQQDTVRATIDRWQQEHPNQWYVSDVRLQDFSAARGRPVHPFAEESQGVLTSLNQTLMKVDEAMLVADRALFLGERMPRLITLQTELLIDQLTEHPMVYQLAGDFSELQKTAAQANQTLALLPQNFAAERELVLKHFSTLIKEERAIWFNEFTAKETSLKDLLARVQTTLEVGSKTAQDYSALVLAIQALAEDTGGEGGLSSSDGDAIQRATQLAVQSQEVARELNLLLENLKGFVSAEDLEAATPHIQQLLKTVKSEEQQLINRAFVLAAILILLALAGALGVALTYRFLAERFFHNKPS